MKHIKLFEQHNTKAFKDWFGNSKVVDDNDEPLIVYHGTNRKISEFSGIYGGEETNSPAAQFGFFFTVKKDFARAFGKNILEVYLSIQNPHYMTSEEMEYYEELDDDVENEVTQFKVELEDDGYDGIILPGFDEIIAFSSRQIKSATDNNRDFDGTKYNIYK